MCIFLADPRTADLAIHELISWRDWSVQDRLVLLYDQKEFDIPPIKRAIVKYFIECSMSGSNQTGELRDLVVTAAKHLKTLEEKDPKTVIQVRRFLPQR